MVKCPVYKCLKEVLDDEQLMKHYSEQHQDLKSLGLDLILDHTSQSNSVGNNVKGKLSNTLTTQLLMISLIHKQQVKDMLKSLNEEVQTNVDI